MTERVNIHSLAHFGENYKIVKIEVTGPKKAHFCKFSDEFNKYNIFRSCERLHFELFFALFFRNAPEYIDPSSHFVFYGILYSSNFLVEVALADVL